MSLLNELKRRNVFRVAAAYLVVSWLLTQVSTTLEAALNLPPWFDSFIVSLLLIGFPLVMFFTWAYEITEDGIKKETEIERDASLTAHTAKKLNIITLLAVVAAGGMFVFQQMSSPQSSNPTNSVIPADDYKDVGGSVTQGAKTEAGNQTIDATTMDSRLHGNDGAEDLVIDELTNIATASIAVLPFVPLSNDESDVYFGKGIAEELLNSLAQFPDLKVAARTSAFSFEGKNVDLREVGKILGVAHVLEGSVRRSGERLRITAQLIRASDGIHLWSETFERNQTDIFAIQDEIVAELSRVLQFQLGVGAGIDRAARKNVKPRAYNEYLRGLDLWWKRDEQSNRIAAINAFRDVTEFDPNFADGWSAFGASLILSAGTSPNMTVAEKRIAIDLSIARALELDPNNVRAYASAVFDDTLPIDVAETYLNKAQELAPNSPLVSYAAGNHYLKVGDHSKSITAFERTKYLDPLNKTVANNRNKAIGVIGKHKEALEELTTNVVCVPNKCTNSQALDAYAGLLIAIQVEQKELVPLWLQRFNNNSPGFGKNPSQDLAIRIELMQKFSEEYLSEIVDENYWSSFTDAPYLGDSVTLWASMFAQRGQVDLALNALERQIIQWDDSLLANLQDTYTLMSGPFEFSESIRRHPRYHALWERPALVSLAKARRANGQTAGLPLPIDGSSSEVDQQ